MARSSDLRCCSVLFRGQKVWIRGVLGTWTKYSSAFYTFGLPKKILRIGRIMRPATATAGHAFKLNLAATDRNGHRDRQTVSQEKR